MSWSALAGKECVFFIYVILTKFKCFSLVINLVVVLKVFKKWLIISESWNPVRISQEWENKMKLKSGKLGWIKNVVNFFNKIGDPNKCLDLQSWMKGNRIRRESHELKRHFREFIISLKIYTKPYFRKKSNNYIWKRRRNEQGRKSTAKRVKRRIQKISQMRMNEPILNIVWIFKARTCYFTRENLNLHEIQKKILLSLCRKY